MLPERTRQYYTSVFSRTCISITYHYVDSHELLTQILQIYLIGSERLFFQTGELQATHQFSGKRAGRWYRAKSGQRIHADINGSYNTLRKIIPTAFELGIEGLAVIPRQFAV
jgi:hypothetical protein